MEISGFYRQMIDALAKDHGVDIGLPYEKLPEFKQELLYGTGTDCNTLCEQKQRLRVIP